MAKLKTKVEAPIKGESSSADANHAPLGAAPRHDPSKRNWKRESDLYQSGLWELGINVLLACPFEILARNLVANQNPYVTRTLTFQDEGIRCYRLQADGEAADLSIRAVGNETYMMLAPVGEWVNEARQVSPFMLPPAADYMHNFIAGTIWMVDNDLSKLTGQSRGATPSGELPGRAENPLYAEAANLEQQTGNDHYRWFLEKSGLRHDKSMRKAYVTALARRGLKRRDVKIT